MRLGLVFVCLVSPWISAELIKDANQTTEENKTVIDETRRDDTLLQPPGGQFKLTSVPLFFNKNVIVDNYNTLKNGEHSDVKIFDQRVEQTENRGLCKNAQFLIELLTVMLPLLNQDVPENTKTSYVLQILKNLLLSSPEAAQDHEVMYKINDLMVTLEKYHIKDSDVDKNALRQSNNPRDVTTKVIFQYEVPHFQNPNCTAELMKVIKVVHEAILKLANNPICVEDVPLLNNIDNILINPELYKHLPGLNQNVPNIMYPGHTEKFLTLPEEQNGRPKVPVFEIDFPEKDNVYPEQQTQPLPFIPRFPNYYPNSNEIQTPDDLPNPYYDSSPSLSPLVNGAFENEPVPSPGGYISLNNPTLMPIEKRAKAPAPFDREFDSGPVSSPNPRDYIPSSDENFPVDNWPQTQFEVTERRSGEIRFGDIRPNTVFDVDLPIKQPKHYLPSKNSLPLNYFDVFGDGSGDVSIVQNESYPIELGLPSNYSKPYMEEDLFQPKSSSLLDVDGDGSGEVYIGQDQAHHNLEPYLEEHQQGKPSSFPLPFEVPEDDSGEFSVDQDRSKPIYEFDLPSKRPKPYIEANLPMAGSSSAFDVTGAGSGEIYIGQDGLNHAFELDWPSNHPKSYKYTNSPLASSSSPFDVPRDGSGELLFGPGQPHIIAENNFPSYRPMSYSEKDFAAPKNDANRQIDAKPIIVSETGDNFASSSFEVSGTGSGEIPFGQDKRHPIYNFHIPSQRPKSYLEELMSPSSSSPFDVSGSGSGEIPFGQNKRYPIFDSNLPSQRPKSFLDELPSTSSSPSPFDVSGSGSGEILFGKDNRSPAFNFNFPSKRPKSYTESDVPSVSLPLPFDVSGDGSEEIYFGQDQPNHAFEFNFPSHHTKPLPSSSPSPFNLDVSGGGSGEIIFGQDRPDPSFEVLPSPSSSPSPFVVTGDGSSTDIQIISPNNPHPIYDMNKSAETAFIPLDQSSLQPQEMYLMRPDKKKPNKYDASPNSLPLINGKPGLYPNLPNQDSTLPIPFSPEEVALLPPDESNVLTQTIPFEENFIISNTKTSQPTELEILNQYVIPSDRDNLPYETVLDAKEILPEDSYDLSPLSTLNDSDESLEKPYKISPDKKVLVLIRDNIDLLEQKVPEIHLNLVIHDKIEKIKKLINLHQITIEEYINIVNQYEILIEHIKNLNGNNKILQELLFSVTNGAKLGSNAGKLHVIELTYLVKRPKPLIYQPYYYIKYQIPYESFVTRINNILVEEPHLRKIPTKLYENLIPLSKVTETSPDLESFGKEDILKITFNNGTLVGAKVVKAKNVDMYVTLDKLKEMNADFTMNDIYQLIKKLDIQLKESVGDGIDFNNHNEPIINSDEVENVYNDKLKIYNQDENTNKLYRIKLKKKPAIAEKVTKITAKKTTSNQVIGDILKRVNDLRPNYSAFRTRDKSMISPDSNISNELRSLSLAETPEADPFSQSNYFNTYDPLSPSEVQVFPEDSIGANLNHYIDTKPKAVIETGDNFASMYSDIVDQNNYPPKIHIGDANDDWNQVQSQRPSPSIQAKLLDATLKAHKYVDSSAPQHLDFSSVTQKSAEFSPFNAEDLNLNGIPQKQNFIGTKLLDATINAHSFKQVNKPIDLSVESAPMLSQQSTHTFSNPDEANSQLEQYNINMNSGFNVDNYKTHPITYIDENPDNIPSNLFKYSQNYAGAYPNSVGPNIVTYSQAYAAHDPINILKKTKTYTVSDPSISERHSVYNNENTNVVNQLNNAYYKNYYHNLNMANNRGRVMVNQNFGNNWGSNQFRHLLQHRIPLLYQMNRTLRPRPLVLG